MRTIPNKVLSVLFLCLGSMMAGFIINLIYLLGYAQYPLVSLPLGSCQGAGLLVWLITIKIWSSDPTHVKYRNGTIAEMSGSLLFVIHYIMFIPALVWILTFVYSVYQMIDSDLTPNRFEEFIGLITVVIPGYFTIRSYINNETN